MLFSNIESIILKRTCFSGDVKYMFPYHERAAKNSDVILRERWMLGIVEGSRDAVGRNWQHSPLPLNT